MKHTKEEIINALKIIKDECDNTNCVDCPFRDFYKIGEHQCKLHQQSPCDWEINDTPP